MKILLFILLILSVLTLSACDDATGEAAKIKANPGGGSGGASCSDVDADGFKGLTHSCQIGADCDDEDPAVHPEADEICGNGIDDNCDGNIDQGCSAYGPVITEISGPFIDDGIVLIRGHGFGTKDPVEPLRYDDFEKGELGESVVPWEDGGWDTVEYFPAPVYATNSLVRLDGEQVLQQTYLWNEGGRDQYIGVFERMDFDQLYVSWWAYRHDIAGTASCSRNFKLMGAMGMSSSGVYGFPQQRIYSSAWLSNGNITSHFYTSNVDGDVVADVWFVDSPDVWFDNWQRVERYSDVRTRNNYAYVKRDGEVIGEIAGDFLGSDDVDYNYFLLGHYFSRGGYFDGCDSSELIQYLGEVYMDTTQMRLELCDSKDSAAAQHCEIQIPTGVWDDGQISFEVNLGEFVKSDKAHLFVVDENGRFSQEGFLVRFDAVCGNGFCEQGESAQNCPSDCIELPQQSFKESQLKRDLSY